MVSKSMKLKNLAIIPARAGSKRLKEKNTKLFQGEPLFLRAMRQARESGLFSEIHLSTDSSKMLELSKTDGFSDTFLRPAELADDKTQLVNVIEFVIREYTRLGEVFDNVCVIWTTSPLKEVEDIENSYHLLTEKVTSVLGVSEYPVSIFSSFYFSPFGLEPVFPNVLKTKVTEQPSVVCCNSSICWFKISEFEKQKTWLMDGAVGYLMPKTKSIDIDDQEDFNLALAMVDLKSK